MTTRPVLRYHGSKFRIAPWVVANLPDHRVYVEPFGGSAAVLLHKPRAPGEIYNDLDAGVVRLFRVLRDRSAAEHLARQLELTPFSRDEYSSCYEDTDDDIEAARRLVARSFMGQSSKGVWQRSGFDTRVNSDGYLSRVNALRRAPEAVRAIADRLQGVAIEHEDAETVIRRHDRADALFYCDPPYLPATRNSKIYRHDMTLADHRRLADVLRSARGMVVLSGYPSELYDNELYNGWTRVARQALTDGAKDRTEVLWLNSTAAAGLRQRDLFLRGSDASRG